ncbi:MAG: hypothetical protein ACKVOT_13220 [Polaromonas sp.]
MLPLPSSLAARKKKLQCQHLRQWLLQPLLKPRLLHLALLLLLLAPPWTQLLLLLQLLCQRVLPPALLLVPLLTLPKAPVMQP